MKINISLLILSFFSGATLMAQERKKDTLFFSLDYYYTISPTITPNLSNQIYSERIEFKKQQLKHTKTNGYILFVGDGFLTKGLKPKKILSIKEYIENRKFYFDGQYNQIIDKWKLKNSLTDKHTIYFVNGNEFIHPRYLEYYSYYPIGKGENAINNNNVKDTLFFKLDNSYINESKSVAEQYLLKDGSGSSSGTFFFKEFKEKNNLHPTPKEILSLENFVHSSRFYDKNKQQKLDDYELANFFSNYVVFLVEDIHGKTKYIQVKSSFLIE
ncbi:hypothetical protein [Flavobacterium sp. ACAM 123]|uniref:hypothetical protein n=1 Tax=Flavobacterium sp. ACAM 123 TaxID=1189620 RepID=UPI0002EB3197|nr:hypothetical protein [Flavobacterium sp. ACAM 123]